MEIVTEFRRAENPTFSTESAFSRQTPDATVERFRKGLKAIRDNGTYDAIAKRWL